MRIQLLLPGAAIGALLLAFILPGEARALPGTIASGAPATSSLVQSVASKYHRRYYRNRGDYVRAPFTEVDTRRGTWVAAPFARVHSGRRGTWVRAPFVNLWVPR